ncbi:sigma-54 interaction domain-containing protein [Caldisalinibacter kiritimatiensis]|uniref:PAS modulated sigma54 specific transcriptional regulator, Fis family n=1 Tax=Caldisalinibacter kiritimatiensis TaxID=1304284 RepID=R1AUK0_9FIRM|nr:sigma-54-dependent Fis family transcriptional regulator [Caldisalinibacter kiritimatiensis]EOD00322.1 PAS modulated sigma54 specific transcriptional regulator, Fis family [Caldisalinibacter kiritimatiensis]
MEGNALKFRGKKELLSDYLATTIEKIFDPVPVPIILIDAETRIRVINKVFADYLGFSKEELIGRKVLEIDKNSRFPYVFKAKKAEIAWKHRFENGHTAIVHRIPVLDENGEVVYGFGLVLFQDVEEFKDIIEKNKLLETELHHYKKQLKEIHGAKYSWDNIIGNSKKMLQAKYIAEKAAQTNSNVLLLGESGTGKELFAHAIHNGSGRNYSPFVKVNCAAIPSELLESELFGYDEGAFTGAKKGGKIGKFELASGGSIFLDEIGDMPMEMQAKLLRVLQEKEIERIGSNNPIKIDVRVIAATNKNLKELVEEGKFREDLYYRLNVMTIEIPPLRERYEDIGQIARLLLKKLSKQLGKYVSKISSDAMAYIKRHNWPGNVRELENVLERAINLTDSDTILPMHLPVYLTKNTKYTMDSPIRPLKYIIEDAEKEAITRCLKYTNGNKLRTAKLLGISRSSLYDKIEKYGIK